MHEYWPRGFDFVIVQITADFDLDVYSDDDDKDDYDA